jgi:threonine dehydratase
MGQCIQIDDIRAAAARCHDQLRQTPCIETVPLSSQMGCPVILKLDNNQRTGSFKERGALNKLSTLSDAEKKAGVIASSAGNHAQAVAFHASRLGIASKIVMPTGTPLIKVSRTREFGGIVQLYGDNYDEAYTHALELSKRTDATFVHPYDDPMVIAGQGTMGLEILNQYPEVNTVIIPVGGGGLIAGVSCALKSLKPNIRIIGVEPEALSSMAVSLAAGDIVRMPAAVTLADGIAVREVGRNTFAMAQEYVDEMVSVNDDEIARAILYLLETEKTVAEGAGAAGVAALLAGKVRIDADTVLCTTVCGGNIDVNLVAQIIDRGLLESGRRVSLSVMVPDKPGSLAGLLKEIGKYRANVVGVQHERAFAATTVGTVQVRLGLDTRGHEHINELIQGLRKAGYFVER